MARRDRSPKPMLRPEGFAVSGQTERMLEPEGDSVTPTEVMKTGLTEEVMDKAQEYVDNPPPVTPQSPVQKAIDEGLIGSADEDFKVKISKATPEGRKAIEAMASRVLGREFNGDLDAFYYCTTFISDMLDSIGADPLDDKGDEHNRTRANAYMKYGTPVNIEDIQEGDIVIFDFPKLPNGRLTLDPTRGKRNGLGDHATFYAGDRLEVNKPGSNFIGVLGGEQGQDAAISMKAFDKSHILGIRRIQYDNIDYEFTKELAKVNPDFDKFIDEEAKKFDFNAFENQTYNPMQEDNRTSVISNRLTSGFKEGGAVMQRQMEMAFMNEGGLTDDGLEVDPVSGNEIPDGSLAQEVRDDIPAQLSEGEYVVPADVVRYYGVKFFEDLRMDAKRGLAEMEANGRIGGEPVPAGGPQVNEAEITDQEMSALRELAMEMNVGGMVPTTNPNMQPPPQAVGNSTLQQTQMMNKGGTVLGFNDSGDTGTTTGAVTDIQNAQAVQSTVPQGGGLGFSLFGSGSQIQNMTGTPTTTTNTAVTNQTDDRSKFTEGQVVYLYKDNQTLPFYMMADYDKYKQKLAEGWSTEQILGKPEITGPEINQGGGGNNNKPPKTKPKKPINEMTNTEIVNSLNSMSTIARAGTALATSMGLPLGAVVNAGLVNQYNNLLAEAEKRGAKLPEGASRKGSIFGGEGSLYDNLYEIDDDGNIVAGTAGQGNFGDTWLGDLLGFDGEAGVQGPGLRDSFRGARRYQGVGTEGSSTTPTTPSSNEDSGPSSSPTPTVIPTGAILATGTVLNNADDPVVSTINESGQEVLQNESSLTAGQQAALDWDE